MLHLSSLHYYACYYALLCLLHQQQQGLSTTIIIDGATTNEWATRDEYQRLVEEAQASQQQQQRQVGGERARGHSSRVVDGAGSSEGNHASRTSASASSSINGGDQSIEQIIRALNQVAAVKAAESSPPPPPPPPPHTSRLVLGAPVDSETETATQDVLSAPDSQAASSVGSNELESALDKLELIERQRAAQLQKLNKLKSLERAAEGDLVKAIAYSKSAAPARLLVLESDRSPPPAAAVANTGPARHSSGAARTISDLVARGDEGLDEASNLMGRETPRRRCGDELISLLELYCRGRFYDGEPQVVQPTITKTKRSVDYAEALAAEPNGSGATHRRRLRTMPASAASGSRAAGGDGGDASDVYGLAQRDKAKQSTNDDSNNHNQQYLSASRGRAKSRLNARYRGIRGAHKECCERACMVDELKPYCGQVN